MSVILLILFVCISYLIVRVGAIALEMTGMEKRKSRFQALSAFTGTGFTTKESELVVNHPRRRKVLVYLMILGNAGIVSVIATSVVSLKPSGIFRPSLNLAIVVFSLLILYRIASHQAFAQRLSGKIRKTLTERLHFEEVLVEEVLRQADGYGVVSVLVGKESKVVGTALNQSGFREKDLMVLSVERDDELIPVPKATTTIHMGDRLICYGKLENLKDLV